MPRFVNCRFRVLVPVDAQRGLHVARVAEAARLRLARETDDPAAGGGTVRYLSPEMLSGRPAAEADDRLVAMRAAVRRWSRGRTRSRGTGTRSTGSRTASGAGVSPPRPGRRPGVAASMLTARPAGTPGHGASAAPAAAGVVNAAGAPMPPDARSYAAERSAPGAPSRHRRVAASRRRVDASLSPEHPPRLRRRAPAARRLARWPHARRHEPRPSISPGFTPRGARASAALAAAAFRAPARRPVVPGRTAEQYSVEESTLGIVQRELRELFGTLETDSSGLDPELSDWLRNHVAQMLRVVETAQTVGSEAAKREMYALVGEGRFSSCPEPTTPASRKFFERVAKATDVVGSAIRLAHTVSEVSGLLAP